MKREWNQLYKSGKQLNKYPSELLVSWIHNEAIPIGCRVLDVGCGFGNNLRFLLNEGFDAYGFDNSEIVVDLIYNEFGKRVSCQCTSNLNFDDQSFDVIIDRQSIQHNEINKIRAAYSECARLLSINGKMFSNFLLSDGDVSKANVNEDDLDAIILKYFNILEKNYSIGTTLNASIQHFSVVYTLTKKMSKS